MNILKYFALVLALFAGMQGAAADETVLVVQRTDGTKVSFRLAERPEMTIEGQDCVFTSSVTSIAIARRSIADFHFESVTDAIEEVRAVELRTEFVDENTVRIRGVEARDVCVFDMNGRSVQGRIEVEGECVTVSLQALPQGVYVVKYAGNAVKIKK